MKRMVLLIFCVMLLISVDVHQEYDPEQLIRFHVLAASDSDADQRLKLSVKDAVVAHMSGQLAGCQTIDDSRRVIVDNQDVIQAIAVETLRRQGCNDSVQVQLGHFDFPVKYYGSFSLPAGNYEAVRVVIGPGQGQNWWCVLFPPLCFVDQNGGEPATDSYTSSEPPQKLVIKWRLLEWLEKWLPFDFGDAKDQ